MQTARAAVITTAVIAMVAGVTAAEITAGAVAEEDEAEEVMAGTVATGATGLTIDHFRYDRLPHLNVLRTSTNNPARARRGFQSNCGKVKK